MSVKTIENADKNHKEVSSWINSVTDLHKGRPPATVNYTKQMPDFDLLMEEWSPALERALQDHGFPGPDIACSTLDYVKIMVSLLEIPVHKNTNEKSVIEGLHVMLTLFSDFKEN